MHKYVHAGNVKHNPDQFFDNPAIITGPVSHDGNSGEPVELNGSAGLEPYQGLKEYITYYNYELHHQGIGRSIPAELYKKAST